MSIHFSIKDKSVEWKRIFFEELAGFDKRFNKLLISPLVTDVDTDDGYYRLSMSEKMFFSCKQHEHPAKVFAYMCFYEVYFNKSIPRTYYKPVYTFSKKFVVWSLLHGKATEVWVDDNALVRCG